MRSTVRSLPYQEAAQQPPLPKLSLGSVSVSEKLRKGIAASGLADSVASASRGWKAVTANVAEHASALAKINMQHANTFAQPEEELTETEEALVARMEKIREESRQTCIQIFRWVESSRVAASLPAR